jgi:rhamnose transport system permease protein
MSNATPMARLAPGPRWRSVLAYPELITLVLLAAAFGVGAMLSGDFLDAVFLLDSTSLYMEVGVMALAMTLVIISGNIDLSVASNLALTSVVCAKLHADAGMPIATALVLGPLIGALLGLFNGLLVAKLRLPSLTVTLGTLALYRGLAQVLSGDHSIGGLPEWFIGIDRRYAGPFPMPLLVFAALAVVTGLALHRSVFGRVVYAIGTNEAAARFSGMRVDRVKLAVFVLSGLAAGIAAVMMLSRFGSAQYNRAMGDELAVITAVVLGGTSIFGGRGSILGTVLALLLLGIIRRGLGLANVAETNQLVITGALLVAAALLARVGEWIGQVRTRRGAQLA